MDLKKVVFPVNRSRNFLKVKFWVLSYKNNFFFKFMYRYWVTKNIFLISLWNWKPRVTSLISLKGKSAFSCFFNFGNPTRRKNGRMKDWKRFANPTPWCGLDIFDDLFYIDNFLFRRSYTMIFVKMIENGSLKLIFNILPFFHSSLLMFF